MTRVFDVVIWGAGVAGLALASHLAQSGHSICVIPRGAGSYPVLPGFGQRNYEIAARSDIEQGLLGQAQTNGAVALEGDVHVPRRGPVASVQVGDDLLQCRVFCFADGCDPRIPRHRGLIPECEPDEMQHLASCRVEEIADFSGLKRQQARKGNLTWETIRGGNRLCVGWPLQSEVDSHTHISELLEESANQLDLTIDQSSIQIENAPHVDRGTLAEDNVLAIGDLTGIVHPLSLMRIEISLQLAGAIAGHVRLALEKEGEVRFSTREFRRIVAPFTQRMMNQDTMHARKASVIQLLLRGKVT